MIFMKNGPSFYIMYKKNMKIIFIIHNIGFGYSMNYTLTYMYAFLYLSRFESSIIKSPLVPLCKNCIYFKPYIYLDNKDDDYKYSLGKCTKFYRISEITGKPIHSHAFLCRIDESQCGYHGKEFVEKTK